MSIVNIDGLSPKAITRWSMALSPARPAKSK